MIENYWYPIVEATKIPDSEPVGLRRLGEQLVLWRDADHIVRCAIDKCTHRAARLSLGKLRDGCLQCPYHGFQFNHDGACVMIPANGIGKAIPKGFDLQTRSVREEHGLIWLWFGQAVPAPKVPWFTNAPEDDTRSVTISRTFDISYYRVLENLLDFHHVAFVHPWSIPGAGTKVEDISIQKEGDEMSFTATLRNEGKRRWLARALFPESARIESRLKLPSLATVEIFPGLRFVETATPIDRDHTWLWARYRHENISRRMGGRILAKMGAWYDLKAIFESGDMRVLPSQQFDDPGDMSKCHFVEADRAIAVFFATMKRTTRQGKSTSAVVGDGEIADSTHSARAELAFDPRQSE
jgi:phenylpropionate dioxygenase-like ring-hydroxylating dioxygenase large terminal subunit